MYAIRAKLDNGHTLSATVPATHAATAVALVHSKLPQGRTIEQISVKPLEGGDLKIRAPRAPKNGAASKKK